MIECLLCPSQTAKDKSALHNVEFKSILALWEMLCALAKLRNFSFLI